MENFERNASSSQGEQVPNLEDFGEFKRATEPETIPTGEVIEIDPEIVEGDALP